MPVEKCTLCNAPSIKGLIKGAGKCQWHWALGNWGIEWASQLYPKHLHAVPPKTPSKKD